MVVLFMVYKMELWRISGVIGHLRIIWDSWPGPAQALRSSTLRSWVFIRYLLRALPSSLPHPGRVWHVSQNKVTVMIQWSRDKDCTNVMSCYAKYQCCNSLFLPRSSFCFKNCAKSKLFFLQITHVNCFYFGLHKKTKGLTTSVIDSWKYTFSILLFLVPVIVIPMTKRQRNKRK